MVLFHTPSLTPGTETRISPVLNKVVLRAITNRECRRIYGKKIQPSNVCARNSGDGAGTCQVGHA